MKNYLLTPGPTSVPEVVLQAMARPMIHHRTPAFEEILREIRTQLQYLFQTQSDVLLLAATGTGAMEAAITNLFSPGESVIVINAGKFGERWAKIASTYQLNVIEITLPPGTSLDPTQLQAAICQAPHAQAVLFQACETSTGVQLPTESICKIAAEANMLSICDAITACGVIDLPMDRWGIDVLLTGSQKALALPPGLAMIALSERAWHKNRTAQLPRFYFNLAKEKKAQWKHQTAWTPAISLICGLQVSLQLIRNEGLETIFKRHEILAEATRNAVLALGLELFAKTHPATSVTAVCVPDHIQNGKKIPELMRTRYGVTIAGGQDELEGKIFRLSHMGQCEKFDVLTGLAALEMTLNDLGHQIQFGKGIGTALHTFYERNRGWSPVG